MNLQDVGTECGQLKQILQDTESMYQTLHDASTADLSQVLEDVKKYASDVVTAESSSLKDTLKKQADSSMADVGDRFRKLESRVMAEMASSGGDTGDGGNVRMGGKAGDAQILKKVTSRMSDFET